MWLRYFWSKHCLHFVILICMLQHQIQHHHHHNRFKIHFLWLNHRHLPLIVLKFTFCGWIIVTCLCDLLNSFTKQETKPHSIQDLQEHMLIFDWMDPSGKKLSMWIFKHPSIIKGELSFLKLLISSDVKIV